MDSKKNCFDLLKSASDLLSVQSFNELYEKLKDLMGNFSLSHDFFGFIVRDQDSYYLLKNNGNEFSSLNSFLINYAIFDDRKKYLNLTPETSQKIAGHDKISLLGVPSIYKTKLIFLFSRHIKDSDIDDNFLDDLILIYPFLLASVSSLKIGFDFKKAKRQMGKNDFLIKALEELAKSLTGAVSTKKIGHIFLLSLTGYTSASFSALYVNDSREDNFFKLASFTGNLTSLPQSIRLDEEKLFSLSGINFYKPPEIKDKKFKQSLDSISPDTLVFFSHKSPDSVRGIVLLGRKLSGREMGEEDFRLIALMTHQIQTPLRNSFFYEEIEKQNRHLLEMNRLLKKEMVDRKRAEINQERTSLKFKTIIDTANEGFFELDKNNMILNLNPEMCSILEASRSELLGRSIFDFVEETAWEKFSGDYSSKQFEAVFKGVHGGKFYCLVNMSAFKTDGDIKASDVYSLPDKFAMVTDISERKEKEKRLSEFKRLISASKDIIAIVNRDGSILPMNAEARLFFNHGVLDIDSFIVNSSADFELHHSFQNSFNGHIAHHKFWYMNEGIEDKKFYDFVLYPYDEADVKGEFDRIILIMRDISELKELESRLVQSQKMEAIGTLAGGIAHDFNNILSGIIGYSELASLKMDQDNPVHSYIVKIREAGYRATDLIKQILSFSRSGVNETENRPLTIMPVIKEALKLLKVSLPSTVIMKTNFTKDKFIVKSNPTSIHQITMNLCTNAAHSMPEGGNLWVECSNFVIDQTNQYKFPELYQGDYFCMKVSDTGVGIPHENQERIFEPFFTTKPAGKGTGIGLSVTLNLIRSMDGLITVESMVGKGSVFTVYLPLVKLKNEKKDLKPQTETVEGGNESILLVDDDTGIIDVMSMILSSLGYRVTTFLSGLDAIESFKNNPLGFDLAILDQTMPYLTGINLSMELIKIRPDLPVILSSGYSCDQYKEKFHEYGIRDFILKPINRKTLGKTVRKVLDDHIST